MFRRCVSILVIAGLLVSHLAAMPHAHGVVSGAEQERHDATPHFHCNWFSGSHSHSHGHSHSHDHSHSEDRHNHEPSDGNAESPEGLQDRDLGGGEHDTDAIYVAQITASLDAKGGSRANESPSHIAAALPHQTDCSDAEQAATRLIWRPPDKVCDESNLYLTIRQLRI